MTSLIERLDELEGRHREASRGVRAARVEPGQLTMAMLTHSKDVAFDFHEAIDDAWPQIRAALEAARVILDEGLLRLEDGHAGMMFLRRLETAMRPLTEDRP